MDTAQYRELGRTLVFGASGYLGRTVVSTLASRGIETVGAHCENPTEATSVEFDFWRDDPTSLVRDVEPDTVIFAANVEDADSVAGTTLKTAAERLVAACTDSRFVYVSSDAVFDGTDGLYKESDTPTPTTDYGTRLVSFENLVTDICSDYCIVRPSYLFGFSEGELDGRLERTRSHLRRDEPVEYFDDMFKSPVEVGQAAESITRLAGRSYVGLVHVGGPRTSVYRFHCDAMSALNFCPDSIKPTSMPEDTELLKDTSLRGELAADLVGYRPASVRDALSEEQ